MVYPLRCEKGRGSFAFTVESTRARLALNSWQTALATLLQFMQSLDNIKCQVLNTRADDETLALIYDVPSRTSLSTQKISKRFKIAVPKEEMQICKPKSLLTFFFSLFSFPRRTASQKKLWLFIYPTHIIIAIVHL